MSQGAPTLASTSSSATTRSGLRAASSVTSRPPSEWPARTARSTPSSSSTRPSRRPYSSSPLPSSATPLPATSTATTRKPAAASRLRVCTYSRSVSSSPLASTRGSPWPRRPPRPGARRRSGGAGPAAVGHPVGRASRPPAPRSPATSPSPAGYLKYASWKPRLPITPAGRLPGAAAAIQVILAWMRGDHVSTMTEDATHSAAALYRRVAGSYDLSTAWLEPTAARPSPSSASGQATWSWTSAAARG